MISASTISNRTSISYLSRHWYRYLLHQRILTPLTITLVYSIFGLVSLYLSDVLFVQHFTDPFLSQIQTLKAGVEIFLTAGLIFFLTNHYGRQLETRTEQIKQQREELSVLHRVLRHNLRNDVNVIMGYAQIIEESSELKSECERIKNAAKQLVHYTNQARRINRITEGNGRIQIYDLSELIPQVLDDHDLVTDEVTVKTRLPDRATVESNRMLDTAIKEVVTNAIRHNDSESPALTLEVVTESDRSHMLELRITDNGPGIPKKELDPLREGKEEQLIHLSGLGLWFVNWTLNHSGGELTITDGEEGGTVVSMWLPKAFDLPMEMTDFPV